jgi:hypothetical protein
MARIVLGLATSHGPQLSILPEDWPKRAEADKGFHELFFHGKLYSFDELMEVRRPEQLEKEITPEKMSARHAASERGLALLGETLAQVAPDVAVIIGDDQEEAFFDDNMPSIGIYSGETVDCVPLTAEQRANLEPGLSIAAWGWYPAEYINVPCEPQLSKHLIKSLIAAEFDVAHSRRLPAGHLANHSVPHAYSFVYLRMMKQNIIPNVPVYLNTFYPPNQPTLRRCFEFGRALRRAIESWDSEKTVAIIASGGLSHFVVEEDLDQMVLSAMRQKDDAALVNLPPERFDGGSSEIRNWIAAAGALGETDLTMEIVDYVPCYRSMAGTGNAMCFAQWL